MSGKPNDDGKDDNGDEGRGGVVVVVVSRLWAPISVSPKVGGGCWGCLDIGLDSSTRNSAVEYKMGRAFGGGLL